LQTLIDEHILSAPVLEHGRFVGFLDVKDLTHFVVFAVDEARAASHHRGNTFNEPAVHMQRSHHISSPPPSLPTVPATPNPEEQAAALSKPSPVREAPFEEPMDYFPTNTPLPHSRPFLETALHGLSMMARRDTTCAITNKCKH
jgi:hypothetical protein